MIDLSSIASLELIQNLQDPKSKHCLLGLLNETLTPMGSRILKSNILQPSTDAEKLKARYEAVEELSSKEQMFHGVRDGSLCTRLAWTVELILLQPSGSLSTQIEFSLM